MRGNLGHPVRLIGVDGSIPACAGEPARASRSRCRCWVYPRLCGGTAPARISVCFADGLSPLVRGNPIERCRLAIPQRSIPACAGEPRLELSRNGLHEVYPRLCGGTRRERHRMQSPSGLSPLVRGNPAFTATDAHPLRSIPACAGEPLPAPAPLRWTGVYPRLCGGTDFNPDAVPPQIGLSPLVRGNRPEPQRHRELSGSIPACAGEPMRRQDIRRNTEVYPRLCGGNPNTEEVHSWGLGSIPACAGEPVGFCAGAMRHRVYPRLCGGTAWRVPRCRPVWGLSPLVRGNREGAGDDDGAVRSIPACAGEPSIADLPC